MKETKYQYIARLLAEKIRQGRYSPGAKLPGHVALAREYGVSTVTSNRALAELQKSGLIVRRERCGSYVNERAGMLTDIYVVIGKRLDEDQQLLGYWRGLCSQAKQSNVSVHMVRGDEPIFSVAGQLDQPSSRGFIFTDPSKEHFVATLARAAVPYLYIGQPLGEKSFSVLEDRRGACRDLVGAMIEDGCRKIGFVGSLDSINHRSARDGYIEGTERLGFGYRYIRDANNENISIVTKDLLASDLDVDAVVIMGGNLPIAALPVMLECPRKPAIGVMTENSAILQLRNVAYVGFYDQELVGKMAFDLLMKTASGQAPEERTIYSPYRILRPGEIF